MDGQGRATPILGKTELSSRKELWAGTFLKKESPRKGEEGREEGRELSIRGKSRNNTWLPGCSCEVSGTLHLTLGLGLMGVRASWS